MIRLLITGASGFIGQYLLRCLSDLPGYQVSGIYRTSRPPDCPVESRKNEEAGPGMPQVCHWYQAELTNNRRLDELFRLVQPDVVVHLAAISDLEAAERDKDLATAVNVGATKHLARLCARHGAKMVFLSTDYVFSGNRGQYREDEAPAPAEYYGKTKWQAEQAISRHLSAWSILRTSLVYGWPQTGSHGNLPTAVIRSLETGRPFYGYTDMYRTPTYAGDVAEGILKLVQGSQPGTHHLGGADWVNMYEFARSVAEVFSLDARRVMPAVAPIADSPSALEPTGEISIQRPKLLGLDSTETAKCLNIRPAGVLSGLEKMRSERRIIS